MPTTVSIHPYMLKICGFCLAVIVTNSLPMSKKVITRQAQVTAVGSQGLAVLLRLEACRVIRSGTIAVSTVSLSCGTTGIQLPV